jgi:phospholipid N-methyltransferase
MEIDSRTPTPSTISSSDSITGTSTGPQGPVPAPCPQGGIPRPAPLPPQLGGEAGEPAGEWSTRYTATYSPDDNKLRLYSATRLDAETYARVRAAGFIFAPKQDLFVAPKWTPEREDLLIELCGEIGDEDTSLAERAEERADRFEGYREKRAEEADQARAAVSAIADCIPLGQPILVGHHSERRARKDAERIENGMRRAVRLWETSNYWTRRAAGAIGHAKYKERPDVRARRIKTIEADQRCAERAAKQAEAFGRLWAKLHEPNSISRKDGVASTFLDRALHLANVGAGCRFGMWSDLRDGKLTPEVAQAEAVATTGQITVRARREITHCGNRLAYERAMLADSGYVPPPKPKTKSDLPLLNYSGTVSYRNPYRRGEVVTSEAVGITKADLAAIHPDYKGTRASGDGTHRVRTAMISRPGSHGRDLCIVYLTDSKQHPRPVALSESESEDPPRGGPAVEPRPPAVPGDRAQAFAQLREQLKKGVTVVSAPQLFPTPAPLAARLVAEAAIARGHRILEPSAGTGSILRAIAAVTSPDDGTEIVAVEVNPDLTATLAHLASTIVTGDFLTVDLRGRFDRIVMNPPFERGVDIRHVLHAFELLAPGGRLVAIVADGPRQNERLRPWVVDHGGIWEPLPSDTFRDQGTSVRTALLVVEARS